MALVNKKAAMMLKDAEAEEKLGEVLFTLLDHDGQRKELKENITRLAIPDSDEQIAREILKVISC